MEHCPSKWGNFLSSSDDESTLSNDEDLDQDNDEYEHSSEHQSNDDSEYDYVYDYSDDEVGRNHHWRRTRHLIN